MRPSLHELSLTSVLHLMPEAVVITDRDERIRYVNEAFTRLTGLRADEALGCRPKILASGRTPPATYAALRAALAAGQPWNGRFCNLRRHDDGTCTTWWSSASITPLHAADGSLDGWVSVQRDVSADVEDEEHGYLAREAAELRALVGKLMAEDRPFVERVQQVLSTLATMKGARWQERAGFFVVDRARGGLRLLATHGRASQEVLEREEHVALGDCLCGRAAEGGEILVSDDCSEGGRHEHASAGTAPHGHYIVPAVADGVVGGVLFLSTEPYPTRGEPRLDLLRRVGELLALALVREEARAELQRGREEALNAARTKAAFLANMSHEIRTPMNGILGMADLLVETSLDERQRDMARTIRSSAEALLGILDDVLDISRIEAGGMTLEPAPLDPVEIVEDVAELLSPQAAAKGLEIAVDVQGDVPRAVVGDRARLRQVLTHLAGNALKFTDVGEVVLSVRCDRRIDDLAILRFGVRDTGVGIPEDRVEAVFESFAQADASTTRRFGGTGLGLAISRQLVELMGGSIGVTSRVGAGSDFHVNLPLALPRSEDRPVESARSLAGRTVLVVDDNRTNRRVLRRMLEGWGCWVREADSGEDALELVERLVGEPWDLAVLDHHMPGMSGLELASRLHARTAVGDAPLVLLSSACPPSAEEQAANHVVAAIAKPIRRRTLRRVVEQALGIARRDEAADGTPVPRASLGLAVLLVEDIVVNQKVATLLLERHGCRVTLACDGQQAVERAAEGGFDLVLMDVQMPRMDGMEATRRIRAAERAAARPRVPIVAMSAHVLAAERRRCLEAGMDGHLAKPIDTDELADQLERIAAARAAGAVSGCGSCPGSDPPPR